MNIYLIAIIQGIVEGLTEFIPVSSTGHLILTGHLLSFEGETAKSFEIFIQLGAILAVAVIFRRRIVDLLRSLVQRRTGTRGLTVWHLGVAMVPALILGFLSHHAIKERLFNPRSVMIGLVVGGVFMLVADRRKTRVTAPTLDGVSYRQAFGIGLFQCLALWPGFSRSGATIAGGMLLGAGYRPATEFSFLLAIPMMIAATSLDLVKSASSLSKSDLGPFLVGFLISFLVAWLVVAAFLRLLNRLRLTPFAIYRFVLALILGLLLLR